MKLTAANIEGLERIFRLNLINSITGIKPANLIGTISDAGETNVAIFSSVIHLGSDPPLIGLVVRPAGDVPRHTYENIRENGFYTINHVHKPFAQRAHQTSAKYDREVSEFEACGLTEEFVEGFPAPFVAESAVKIGLKFEEEVPIKLNRTIFVIGSVQLIIVPDGALDESGRMDLGSVGNVGISGLDGYYHLERFAQFEYARPQMLQEE